MNPELGPVVAASPKRRLSYLSGCGYGIFELVREERMDAWVDSWVVLCGCAVGWIISRGDCLPVGRQGWFAIVKSWRNEAVKFLRKSMIGCEMD
jgi:hypothetical protein